MKSIERDTPVNSEMDLEACIFLAVAIVKTITGIFENVR